MQQLRESLSPPLPSPSLPSLPPFRELKIFREELLLKATSLDENEPRVTNACPSPLVHRSETFDAKMEAGQSRVATRKITFTTFRKLSIRRGLFSLYSTTCAWQPIADHNEQPESYTTIRRFLSELVDMISLPMDRNYWEVTNLSFALPILYYLNVTYNWEDITILWQRIVDACVALG